MAVHSTADDRLGYSAEDLKAGAAVDMRIGNGPEWGRFD